ncbi:bacillithiol system redox-active protein YtxJ [Pedobacter montanisoli]|uniref:Bacillithiol system redox-active protein YtxJ n=1 Tax=Pedobacter montanisoli TaxID=2923277 RepID=A0ABS9ZSL5_9SPHI|nr:bacillithiol system redox-active protein YtxJ [Pedobacter montanisoli]MCJ0741328.1 bacillithiol system redox-active protein YtxJ [Pedobacter montanisoli]
MRWQDLTSTQQVDEIKQTQGYSVIFKHSTRCSVSSMAKRSFEFGWESIPSHTKLYFLDLIAHRDVSNYIAETFHVHHESPQALLIKNGECILDSSHSDISAEEIAAEIEKSL